MQLFYSGSYASDKVQPDAAKSIGGFISSSPLLNSTLNNVFSNITGSMVRTKPVDVRLIVLKNNSGADKQGVKIHTVRGTYSTYKIAAVEPAVDNCDRLVFEKLPSLNSLPFQAVLSTHEGISNALEIGEVLDGATIGIWIQRELDQTQFGILDGKDYNWDPFSGCRVLTEQLQLLQSAGVVEDSSSLIISWT